MSLDGGMLPQTAFLPLLGLLPATCMSLDGGMLAPSTSHPSSLGSCSGWRHATDCCCIDTQEQGLVDVHSTTTALVQTSSCVLYLLYSLHQHPILSPYHSLLSPQSAWIPSVNKAFLHQSALLHCHLPSPDRNVNLCLV